MSSFEKSVTAQRVDAFRKRMAGEGGSDEPSSSKRSNAKALLSGGQEAPPEQTPDSAKNTEQEFTENYSNSVGPLVDYMKQVAATEYNETNRDSFFAEEFLVKKFGHAVTFRMRLGFEKYSQGYKLYIRRENLKDKPTVASIALSELTEIVDYIKSTMAEIDASIEKKEPLFHYGPREIRNPRNPSFWDHDDAFLSTSITARMRFMHVRNDRYQFFINSPIVLDSKRFNDYLGPILTWCKADVEQFLKCVEDILGKVHPDEL